MAIIFDVIEPKELPDIHFRPTFGTRMNIENKFKKPLSKLVQDLPDFTESQILDLMLCATDINKNELVKYIDESGLGLTDTYNMAKDLISAILSPRLKQSERDEKLIELSKKEDEAKKN